MGQMRYIIIGAGAVGGTIGGCLFQGGHHVVLVARGAHLGALRARGLRLATPSGTHQLDIPVVGGPAELRLQSGDVLILATKTQDAAALLAEWAWQPVPGAPASAGSGSAGSGSAGSASAGSGSAGSGSAGSASAGSGAAGADAAAASVLPIVCAQNGVASERFALRRFRRVYGMCVWLPATHLEPGTVEAQGAPLAGLLYVGRYPAGTDPTIERIAGDLAKSRFLAPVSTDVMRWKYGKLLDNLGNAIEALCGRGAAGFGAGPAASDGAELRRRTRAEGIAVLAAAGLAHADREEMAAIRGDRVRIEAVNGTSRPGGSSWQSLTRGTGTIEADFLNGEIALLGREHGVPAPVNEALQRLANQAARERRAPGFMTPAQVLAAAGVTSETPSGRTGNAQATDPSAAGRPSGRRG
jgi:2-dehydropantoate 2-reductase